MGRAHEVRKEAMARTSLLKSKLYSKFGKEIYMAAKSGSPDPDTNQTLKKIIEKAKASQVPADVIKRNIEKAKGLGGADYVPVRYEGFGPGNSMIIVECMTDNVNRTFGEIRSCFTKTGGKIGVAGSVTHQFSYVSLVSFEGLSEDEALEALMEAECDVSEIESDEDIVTVIGKSGDLDRIKEALQAVKDDIVFIEEKVTYLPNDYIKIDDDDIRKFNNFLAMTDELDDVQEVFSNIDFPPIEE
ncbi:MAG: YebC/PmpR family DNA-binding transcriptional regulator [Candidatus Izemoplasmatales bacterium]|nr:YebC/PmpR family DNA-binding transcriptional regulator [Candidatus Izemoplasmatales bacterium]MDD3864739.1 YebC/PmpR family DNA-binding transcriptional regulator [Candidatus Izemoplasmatales bacterium]